MSTRVLIWGNTVYRFYTICLKANVRAKNAAYVGNAFVCVVYHGIKSQVAELGQHMKKYSLHILGLLTLTLPGPSAGVSGSLDSYCNLKPLCSGMGEVVPARTSPTLLPPSPRTVLSLSCFKVSQCIKLP